MRSTRRSGTIGGQFAPRLIELLEAPAWRVASLSAHRYDCGANAGTMGHGSRSRISPGGLHPSSPLPLGGGARSVGPRQRAQAGVSADLDEVTAMAVALEAKHWAQGQGVQPVCGALECARLFCFSRWR